MHLTVDGVARNRNLLTQEQELKDWLGYLVERIGMKPIDGPHVVKYENYGWGLSGFVIIAESNISVHTFPESPFVYVDVFSCQPFDHVLVTQLIVNDFEMAEDRYWSVLNQKRGSEWKETLVVRDAKDSRKTMGHKGMVK